MRLTIQMSAALVLALGALFYLGSVTSGTRSVAFAQVVEKLNDARTLTFRTRSQVTGQKPVTAKYLFKAPSYLRLESSSGLISIMDGGPDKALYLEPATKTAFHTPGPGKGVDGTFHPGVQVVDQKPFAKGRIEFSGFNKLKSIAGEKAEPLGKKNIAGVQAQGFRVRQSGEVFTVWADPNTSLPLEIEQKFRVGDREITVTSSDFVFDARLDDSLFSLELPLGYRLRED